MPNDASGIQLNDRQQRELEYHREHAKEKIDCLDQPFSWSVLADPSRRWWNAYWQMYAYLRTLDLQRKKVLIVGCGFGDDALRVAKLGAEVYAFDLSPESLAIAKKMAARERLTITFAEMPAESLAYEDGFFDYVIARDILHHVDIDEAMREIIRVAKPQAILVVNEIYSHSITNRIRNSDWVESFFYPRMRRFIYGTNKPYITSDERKLTESDIKKIHKHLRSMELDKYFNFLVTRLFPDRFSWIARVDRMLLKCLRPFASILAGRVLFAGRIAKANRH